MATLSVKTGLWDVAKGIDDVNKLVASMIKRVRI